MLKDKCAQFEDGLTRGEDPGEELVAHAARCPQCAALAATRFTIPPVPTAPEDPLLRATLAQVNDLAVRRAVRDARRRRLVPLLIGLAGYALGAVGIISSLRPTDAVPATAVSASPAVFSTPALPPPSPATVGLVLLLSVVWMAGVLAWARRKAQQEAPPTPSA